METRKHHPSDALAGIAIGAFAARFANELLELDEREDVQVSAAPLEGGVAFALTIRW